MRRLSFLTVLCSTLLLILSVPAAKADGSGEALTFSGPEGGQLLYNPAIGSVMNGSHIPITLVSETPGTASDPVSGLSCSGGTSACGWLQFSTGSLISQTSTQWTYNGGGMVEILGTVPGQSGGNVKLVTGIFVGPVTMTQVSGDTWELSGDVSLTSGSSSIQSLFPSVTFPTNGQVTQLTILFHVRPNGGFIGTVASTSLSTAPEPSSMMLLGSGLIGVGWFLRRRKKVAA